MDKAPKYTTGRWKTWVENEPVFVEAATYSEAADKLKALVPGKLGIYGPEIDTRGLKAPAEPAARVKYYKLTPKGVEALRALEADPKAKVHGNVEGGLYSKGLVEYLGGNNGTRPTEAGHAYLLALKALEG